MKTLLKGILTGIGFAIGLLLVFFIWGQIHKALPINKRVLHNESTSIVDENADPFFESIQQFEKHMPELEISKMTRSDNGDLIVKLKGTTVLTDGATIIIPSSETKDLSGVAKRIKTIIDLSEARNESPIKELKVNSKNNIGVVYAEDSSPADDPSPEPQVTAPHIVYPGESWDDIARHYGVSVENIKAVNGISDNESIQVGSKLIIPR